MIIETGINAISIIAFRRRATIAAKRSAERCSRRGLYQFFPQRHPRRVGYFASLLVITVTTHLLPAQEKSHGPLNAVDAKITTLLSISDQNSAPSPQRRITISDAVSIFLQQNLQLGAARYDCDYANAELARGQFQMAVWQLTNDMKRKFYTVVLDQSLLDLAKQNQTTFAEVVKHTTELLNAGDISGLDLERLEVEKL